MSRTNRSKKLHEKGELKFDNGLVQYIQSLNEGKIPLHPVIYFKKEDPENRLIVEVAMQYSDGFNETLLTFANNINNHDGGTHLSGFKTAMTGTINRYAEAANLMKDIRPSGDDVREGLVAIISVKLPERQFESQTKDKLLNLEVESFVQQAVNEKFGSYLQENPKEAKTIFEKGMLAAEAREAASRKARELTRRKNSLEGNSLPGKLADCRSKSNETTEIYIVEGPSAGGSAKTGRDSEFQAILPLKGKIQNVEKANIVKMLRARGAANAHHRAGLRLPRRPGLGKTAIWPGHHHDRRRRGRQPYSHAVADVLLPPYAGVDSRRPRVCCAAAALQGHAQEKERICS